MQSKDAALRHIGALFNNLDGLKFLVCGKDDFAGRWFDDLHKAAEWGIERSAFVDVYVGMGVRREVPEAGKRGDAADVDGIPGLWCDLDIAGIGHKKKNLIPTVEEARKFVFDLFPFNKPSLVIFSGHGLQAYWLFNEFLVFESPDERKKVAKISERFSATIKAFAKTRGYGVDSVYDLSRVLRLAGTVNRKDVPVPTTIEYPAADAKIQRYEIGDLEALLVAEEMIETEDGKSRVLDPVGYLVLAASRKPPQDALLALVTNNDKASLSWDRKRTDLQDQSPSSYDFSLAVIAAKHGWSDQDIADLLLAWRAKHGLDPKQTKKGSIRLDYYQRTISKAKAIAAKEAIGKVFESEAEGPITDSGAEVPAESRADILTRVRRVFGLPIEKFIQRGTGDGSLFSFMLADGTIIPLGTAAALDSQSVIRSKIYPIAHKFPMRLKNPSFDRMMAALGSIVELVENPESSRSGKFATLLTEYFYAKTSNLREADWTRNLQSGDPFIRDGFILLSTANLESWIRFAYTRKVTADDLWTDLPAWGFVSEVIQNRIAGRKVSRRYWKASINALEMSFGFTLPTVSEPNVPIGEGTGSNDEDLEARKRLEALGSAGGASNREGSRSDPTPGDVRTGVAGARSGRRDASPGRRTETRRPGDDFDVPL